ncbi:hypothetical protein QPK32_05220 [Massilia sp. YIM B02763]|uniref:hypothetical protein n=1 Tax=Massilia sp. YIM B02763 TaxID=3050130 RepID=UPI0025B6D335|nr:hypothetical protein [Massilia sp. YIM B02763]MDN4052466.1 hypothetical protein [Massilia sp. YIM B02763]
MQTRRIARAPGLLLLLLLPLLAAAQAQTAGARQAEQARRDAAVADETQTKQPAAPSYGPVLTRRDAPGTRASPAQAVPGRKDPAEVHDETDTLMRHEPQPSAQPPSTQPPSTQPQQQPAQPARRRPGAQATGPMAPRPLRSPQAVPPAGVPVPPPAAAPQPVVPSSTAVRGCQGSFCTDAGGNSFSTGGGAAGVNSSGRLCTRSGATVQCF